MVPVTTAVFALSALGCSHPAPHGGAATPDDAVDAYVHALNENDADALRALSSTSGPTLDAGIERRLDDYGGRGIELTTRQVTDGPAPHQATALLSGDMKAPAGEVAPYEEKLFLNAHEERWYVNLHDTAEPTGTPPLPTAGTGRP